MATPVKSSATNVPLDPGSSSTGGAGSSPSRERSSSSELSAERSSERARRRSSSRSSVRPSRPILGSKDPLLWPSTWRGESLGGLSPSTSVRKGSSRETAVEAESASGGGAGGEPANAVSVLASASSLNGSSRNWSAPRSRTSARSRMAPPSRPQSVTGIDTPRRMLRSSCITAAAAGPSAHSMTAAGPVPSRTRVVNSVSPQASTGYPSSTTRRTSGMHRCASPTMRIGPLTTERERISPPGISADFAAPQSRDCGSTSAIARV